MSTSTDTIEIERTEIKKPRKWKVVIHNDDVTPMMFVVGLLQYVFGMDQNKATELTIMVHTEGHAVAGIYSYEVAEQKYHEAQLIIKSAGYALRLSVEEE